MSEFIKIKLVSPAVIGGANSRSLDQPPTMRPPEIRGQLRFWMRALAGGNCNWQDKSKHRDCLKKIHEIENNLFGDNTMGQRLILYPAIFDSLKIKIGRASCRERV